MVWEDAINCAVGGMATRVGKPSFCISISKQKANDGPQLAASIFLVSPGPQLTRCFHVHFDGFLLPSYPFRKCLPGTPKRCASSLSWTFLNPSSWQWRLNIAWDKLPTQRQTLEPLMIIDLMIICPSVQLFEFTFLMVLPSKKNFWTHILLPPHFHHHHSSSPRNYLLGRRLLSSFTSLNPPSSHPTHQSRMLSLNHKVYAVFFLPLQRLPIALSIKPKDLKTFRSSLLPTRHSSQIMSPLPHSEMTFHRTVQMLYSPVVGSYPLFSRRLCVSIISQHPLALGCALRTSDFCLCDFTALKGVT